LAHERGCVLAIVHNFQFARSFLRLQADIAAGRLGAIRNIWALQLSNPARRLPAWYGELPGGLFFDESPHLLYLVRRLLPDMMLVYARRTPSSNGGTTPAEVYVQLRNNVGQTATLLMNFEAALSEWHVVVNGERGTADVDIFRDIYHFAPNDGAHTARDILRTSFSAATAHLFGTFASGWLHVRSRLDYGNREIFRRFADAIHTRTLQPEYIGSHEAVAVRELQQEILEA
jgi:predicted dehydrogenase